MRGHHTGFHGRRHGASSIVRFVAESDDVGLTEHTIVAERIGALGYCHRLRAAWQ